ELNEHANRLAHHLRSLGVGPETPVGLCLERSLELVIGLLGILKAGGAYLPLDPTFPPGRLRFMLEDARAPAVLPQAALLERFPNCPARVVRLDSDWEDMGHYGAMNPICETSPGNLAYVMYTSGSTGQPKGVLVPHRGVVHLVCGMTCARL